MRIRNKFDVFLLNMTKLSKLSKEDYNHILNSLNTIKINHIENTYDETVLSIGYIVMPNGMMIDIDFSIYQTLIQIVSALLSVEVKEIKNLITIVGCNPVEWMIFLTSCIVISSHVYLRCDYINRVQKNILVKLQDIFEYSELPLNHPENFIHSLINSKDC